MGPLTILVTLLGLCSAYLNIDVQISDGPLRGEIMKSRLGREFVGFKGIPYAEPPVGMLRFSPALRPSKWTKVRENMRQVPQCIQRNMYQPVIEIAGDEDCLYLSVYTPSATSDAKLPVMVFIHGGGLEIGQGFVYEPNFLLDKDIVLVIIQYRLGPLGFLSTGDTVCPGNEGLKDQVVALKWVRSNIKYFGGDPELITLFGQSAGAASVETHLYSPLTEGLFHRAILQSGSSLAPWFTTKSLTSETQQLAAYLGCTDLESKSIVDCMRQKKAEEIIRALTIFEEWERDPQFIFRAVVETEEVGKDRFLTELPIEAMHSYSVEPIPVMLGMNSDEGFFKVTELVSHPKLMDQMSKDYKMILPYALQYKYSTSNPKEVTEKLMKFYFEDSEIGMNNIRSLINLYTDAWFTESIERSAWIMASRSCAKSYFYYFTYRGERSLVDTYSHPGGNFGVSHGDETLYLFPFEFQYANQTRDSSDTAMIEFMTELWTHFAKHGQPPSDLHWKSMQPQNVKDPSSKFEYLEIANATMHKERYGLLTDRITFWKKIINADGY